MKLRVLGQRPKVSPCRFLQRKWLRI